MKILGHFQNLGNLGNFSIFLGIYFCMSKIDIHTDFYEKRFKIECYLIKSKKNSVANLYGSDFIYIQYNDFTVLYQI